MGKRACKGQQLTLAGREIASSLPHAVLVAARKFFDERSRIHVTGALADVLVPHRLVAEADILIDGTRE